MSSSRLQSLKSMDALDKYTQGIDFSNACREFYMHRVKATETFKKQMKMGSDDAESTNTEVPARKKSSIQSAMDKLRTEMVSLMDQDLCLMRQLLTLNETIEDIKTKRLYGMSKSSLPADSRDDLSGSEWSVSETDLYVSDEDLAKPETNSPRNCIRNDTVSKLPTFTDSEKSRLVNKDIVVSGKSVQCFHGVQRSIDSGYDESDTYQTDIEVSL